MARGSENASLKKNTHAALLGVCFPQPAELAGSPLENTIKRLRSQLPASSRISLLTPPLIIN